MTFSKQIMHITLLCSNRTRKRTRISNKIIGSPVQTKCVLLQNSRFAYPRPKCCYPLLPICNTSAFETVQDSNSKYLKDKDT